MEANARNSLWSELAFSLKQPGLLSQSYWTHLHSLHHTRVHNVCTRLILFRKELPLKVDSSLVGVESSISLEITASTQRRSGTKSDICSLWETRLNNFIVQQKRELSAARDSTSHFYLHRVVCSYTSAACCIPVSLPWFHPYCDMCMP